MAAKYNITIEQGATFSLSPVLKKADGSLLPLAGYIGRCQLRSKYKSADAVDVEVTVGPAEGTITLYLSAEATALLPAPALWVYDVEIEDAAGVVIRVLEGRVSITPEVTRPSVVVV